MAKPIPRGSSSPASPGFFGALKDAVGAIAKSTSTGRTLTNRGRVIDAAVDGDGDTVSRLRRQQTSDRHN